MAADNERPTQNKRREERRIWVWIMLMITIVFALLLMTLGIIALQVGNYLPEGTDIIFVVGKSPSVDVSDGENKTWESGKVVNIFQADYVNDQGITTVVSQDGTKLIAPGTETSYKFTMYNNGNMAVFYETDLNFTFKIGNETQTEYTFPLQVQLITEDGEYLIGGEGQWVEVNNATLSKHVRVLGANSYETFTLRLKWLFDGGDDELDTMYGDQTVEKGVDLTLGISTYAEEHLDPSAEGGTKIDGEVTESGEYGGTVRSLWLVLVLIVAAVILFYVAWLLNKRLRNW